MGKLHEQGQRHRLMSRHLFAVPTESVYVATIDGNTLLCRLPKETEKSRWQLDQDRFSSKLECINGLLRTPGRRTVGGDRSRFPQVSRSPSVEVSTSVVDIWMNWFASGLYSEREQALDCQYRAFLAAAQNLAPLTATICFSADLYAQPGPSTSSTTAQAGRHCVSAPYSLA